MILLEGLLNQTINAAVDLEEVTAGRLRPVRAWWVDQRTGVYAVRLDGQPDAFTDDMRRMLEESGFRVSIDAMTH